MPDLHTLMTGLVFGESPRWHEDRLWFSDWGAQEVIAVDLDGKSEVITRIQSFPFCIDFLPDGRLLVVSACDRVLLRREPDGELLTHAMLSSLSDRPWNEIVVDGRGNAYLNNIGFDFPGGEFAPGIIALVTPDGSARQVADGVAFPNGMCVSPDNSTLIVAESYGKRLTAFDIDATGHLANRRVWADLGDGPPDGICLDAENAIWYSDVPNKRCVRVREGVRCCRPSTWIVGASLAHSEALTRGRCSWWQPSGVGRRAWQAAGHERDRCSPPRRRHRASGGRSAGAVRRGAMEDSTDWEIDSHGSYVATRSFLVRRGFCCANQCRNCPYINWRDSPAWQPISAEAVKVTAVSPKALEGARKALAQHEQQSQQETPSEAEDHRAMIAHYRLLLGRWVSSGE